MQRDINEQLQRAINAVDLLAASVTKERDCLNGPAKTDYRNAGRHIERALLELERAATRMGNENDRRISKG
jgi:hypothetical protein